MIQAKNFLRALVGFTTSITPSKSNAARKVYINLRGGSQIGGPNRFLRNLTASLQTEQVQISNWILNGCNAALVFSASWGNSFTWLCRRLGIRSVLRVDGFYVPEIFGLDKKHPLTRRAKWVNERLKEDLKRFDYVIYQSAFSKEQADLHLYHRTNAYSIIHNGADTRFFRPRKVANRDNHPTMIVLGKHYPENLSLALDVFMRVRTIQDVKLLIVGPMRDGTEQVADFVANYLNGSSSKSDVECLGTVLYEQLPDTLLQADVFLHVKVGDWCPNAVIEALACGLPVVCPAFGGTKELIGSGGIAVESAPWRIDAALCNGMAEATLEILRNLDRFKASARETAIKRLNRSEAAKQYLNVLGLTE